MHGNLDLDFTGLIRAQDTHECLGKISGVSLRILNSFKRAKMDLQLRLVMQKLHERGRVHSAKVKNIKLDFSLHCIVYGPRCAYDNVEDFLEGCDIYLQDPQGCDRNVEYRNPQRLNGDKDDAPMTNDRVFSACEVVQQDQHKSSIDTDAWLTNDYLQEADNPPALKTNLFQHQRQALHFMQEREKGWDLDGQRLDIWKSQLKYGGLRVYLNTINDEEQFECPPNMRGGILADEMGLGKTITMISLIASDLGLQSADLRLQARDQSCTLVVLPPGLMDTWEHQLKLHSHAHLLLWRRHHGRDRLSDANDVLSCHLVLTTYDTISSEWRHRESKDSILFSTRWRRVVLDEAHNISNKTTRKAESIYALRAERRWAVSGTPIQNHLDDFVSLLHFLQVHPYDDRRMFDEDIVTLWKLDAEAAGARLKRIFNSISLLRKAPTISLPPRTDIVQKLSLTEKERQLYEPIELEYDQLRRQLEFLSKTERSRSGLLSDVLQRIHVLRSICNFGLLAKVHSSGSGQGQSRVWTSLEAQDFYNMHYSTKSPIECVMCKSTIDVQPRQSETTTGSLSLTRSDEILVSRCRYMSHPSKKSSTLS